MLQNEENKHISDIEGIEELVLVCGHSVWLRIRHKHQLVTITSAPFLSGIASLYCFKFKLSYAFKIAAENLAASWEITAVTEQAEFTVSSFKGRKLARSRKSMGKWSR